MDLGTVAIVALIAGLAGGAVGAALVGTAEPILRRRLARNPNGAWQLRSRQTYVHAGPPPPEAFRGPPRAAVMGPFDRFNESGKRVLSHAQDEAIRANHNYIGTEHLLAGILRDGDTIAARALQSLGIELTKARTAIEFTIGRGDQTTSPSEITLSPRTKKVIELAIDESRGMGQRYVGAEHVLLGIVREGEGMASGIIESLGTDLSTVRAKVLELLASSGNPPPASYTAASPRRGHGWGPFTRFGDRAKRVLAFAQDEAIGMGHTYIGPEHLLLGLGRLTEMAVPDADMKRIFDTLAITLDQLRTELGKVIPPTGRESLATEITLSPETKEIIQVVNESAQEGSIVPEDLLLAMVRDDQSFTTQILTRLGATAERVRAALGR